MERDEIDDWQDAEYEGFVEQEQPPDDWNGPIDPPEVALAADAEDYFCAECGGVVRQDAWFNKFRVHTCYECRKHDPLLALTSKSKAASEYLLPPRVFNELPYLERPNPNKPSYQPMKLYLVRDLEREAVRIHGALVNIEHERKRRHDQALAQKEERMMKRMKKTIVEAAVMRQIESRPARHQHVFEPSREVYDPETEQWTQSCVCGFTLPFEKF